jgi:hypothetical protein
MNNALAKLCDQFLTERRYLKNVAPAAIIWYQVAFKCYRATVADERASPENRGESSPARDGMMGRSFHARTDATRT